MSVPDPPFTLLKSQSPSASPTPNFLGFEIICGLVIYRLYKLISDGDDVLGVETSDSTALFAIADRLAKLYDGGKVSVGLQIPDADTASPKQIDLVLLNKGQSKFFFSFSIWADSLTSIIYCLYSITIREAVVIAVKNLSGFISVKPDGSWVSESITKHKADQHPDPVSHSNSSLFSLLPS
ncbi:hypothetical protein ABKV19_010163 [Rosa sericea]